mgnify:CR=1 FL=1
MCIRDRAGVGDNDSGRGVGGAVVPDAGTDCGADRAADGGRVAFPGVLLPWGGWGYGDATGRGDAEIVRRLDEYVRERDAEADDGQRCGRVLEFLRGSGVYVLLGAGGGAQVDFINHYRWRTRVQGRS